MDLEIVREVREGEVRSAHVRRRSSHCVDIDLSSPQWRSTHALVLK